MKKLVCILSFALVATCAVAEEPDLSRQSAHAIRLFEEGCFQNSGDPQRVNAWAQSAVLLEMPAEQSKSFLAGASGKAWLATNALGVFIISIADNGVCSVYARKVKTALLKELYLAFLPKPGTDMAVEKKIEETKKTPKGDLYTLGHEIGKPGVPAHVKTSLSTSEGEQAPMQGILSLSVMRR